MPVMIYSNPSSSSIGRLLPDSQQLDQIDVSHLQTHESGSTQTSRMGGIHEAPEIKENEVSYI